MDLSKKAMFRSRFTNFLIALGIVLAYSAVASAASDFKQTIFRKESTTSQPIEQVVTKPQPSEVNQPVKQSMKSADLFEPAPIQTTSNESQALFLETVASSKELKPSRPLLPEKQIAEFSPPKVPVIPEVPVRLVIPAIELDAPIVPAETNFVKVGGKEYQQWIAPSQFAAGWHENSARLGEPGNTVLNGHHNIYGEVFRYLVDLQEGDTILVSSDSHVYEYVITNKMILPEKYQEFDIRMDNAKWILPSQDERITLISCWPYESNTHRLIIVASPVSRQNIASN
jgi:sortase A